MRPCAPMKRLVLSGLFVAALSGSAWAEVVVKDRDSLTTLKIWHALDEPTSLEFIDVPLADATMYLADLHAIQIVIDYEALDEVGIAEEVPISVNLRGISLMSALDLTLRPLCLDWLVRDEVLLITSMNESVRFQEVRIYSLAEFKDLGCTFAQLCQALDHAMDLGDVGGGAWELGDKLVVRATQRQQRDIYTLLTALSRKESGRTAKPDEPAAAQQTPAQPSLNDVFVPNESPVDPSSRR